MKWSGQVTNTAGFATGGYADVVSMLRGSSDTRGNVGAGTGMRAFAFKGGIGSASRRTSADPKAILSAELVTVDRNGQVRACASFAASSLDPPFLAARRAVLGRFAVDPALDGGVLIAPLVALGQRLAAQAEARTVELTELTPPSTPLYRAGLVSGAVAWSRILTRASTPRAQL